MEYASRGDLLDYINKRSRRGIGIGEELAKSFFIQLAEGVAHCHRRNVVHRLDEPYSYFDRQKTCHKYVKLVREADNMKTSCLKYILENAQETVTDLS